MDEQTRKDRELEPITQLQTAVHTVQTYQRDSAWSASCSASETRPVRVLPQGRYYSLKMHRGWMDEQTRKDRELEPITQLQTAVHTVQTYFRDSAWSASC